jgi:hypothetical protein
MSDKDIFTHTDTSAVEIKLSQTDEMGEIEKTLDNF